MKITLELNASELACLARMEYIKEYDNTSEQEIVEALHEVIKDNESLLQNLGYKYKFEVECVQDIICDSDSECGIETICKANNEYSIYTNDFHDYYIAGENGIYRLGYYDWDCLKIDFVKDSVLAKALEKADESTIEMFQSYLEEKDARQWILNTLENDLIKSWKDDTSLFFSGTKYLIHADIENDAFSVTKETKNNGASETKIFTSLKEAANYICNKKNKESIIER